jgi:FtsZ-binding cell division protein ZapB
VLYLQDQLADAHKIVGVLKGTIAELLKENKRLLAQKEEQEKATSDAKCENDEFKAKLKIWAARILLCLQNFGKKMKKL